MGQNMRLVFFGLLLHLAHTYSIDTILLIGFVEWNNIPTTQRTSTICFIFLPFHLICYLMDVVIKNTTWVYKNGQKGNAASFVVLLYVHLIIHIEFHNKVVVDSR